jgi:NTE family protein
MLVKFSMVMEKNITKNVALVLSSGGPRGFAYIGAIEELESRGYKITSVAGTSIGSLIGGIYAAGKLQEVKDWLFSLDAWKVFKLMDLSISNNHLVKGEKVIEALMEIVPKVNIEDLEIPYKAIAADLYTGEEVVFDRGDLFTAVRASISIPSLFRPVTYGYRTLVDGGIVNTLPLNRVERSGDDILVAFDVNGVDVDAQRNLVIESARQHERREEQHKANLAERKVVMDAIMNNDSMTFMEKVKLAGQHSYKMFTEAMNARQEELTELEMEQNYYGILSRSFSLMNHVIAKQSIELYKPEVLATMPFDAFDEISDYARAKDIAEVGRHLMKEALDKYEKQ